MISKFTRIFIGGDKIKPIEIRVLIEKQSDEFNLKVPAWIGEQMGNLLIMQYDGKKLTIMPAYRA